MQSLECSLQGALYHLSRFHIVQIIFRPIRDCPHDASQLTMSLEKYQWPEAQIKKNQTKLMLTEPVKN